MKTILISALQAIKDSNIHSDKIIVDSGSELSSGTDAEFESWLIEIGSNWDELDIRCDFDEFCDACIDAINGYYLTLNKILGFSKNNTWNDAEIIERFERITGIIVDVDFDE